MSLATKILPLLLLLSSLAFGAGQPVVNGADSMHPFPVTGTIYLSGGSITSSTVVTISSMPPVVVSNTLTVGGTLNVNQAVSSSPWMVAPSGGSMPIAGNISNTSFVFYQGEYLITVDLQRVGFSQTIHGEVSPQTGAVWKTITLYPTTTIQGTVSLSNTAFVAYQGEYLWTVDIQRIPFSQTIHGTVVVSNTLTVGGTVVISSLPAVVVSNTLTVGGTVVVSSLPAVVVSNTLTVGGEVLMKGSGLTSGVVDKIAMAREGTNTPYSLAVYPMGNWLATPESSSAFIGTSAVPVFTNVSATFTSHLLLRNHSNTNTVYVGGSSVTASSGIPIYPLEAFTMDATTHRGSVWYAIVPAGSADLRISRW
jgi:hypothetical protein